NHAQAGGRQGTTAPSAQGPRHAGRPLFRVRAGPAPRQPELSHECSPVERWGTHLSPAQGARHRDDARRRAQARRCPALRAPGRRRIPAQPDHRLARLSGARGRSTRRKTQRPGNVRHRRGIEETAVERTRTLPQGGMAAGARAHPAPGPVHGRTAQAGAQRGCRMTTATMTSEHVVSARNLRKAYKTTVALDNADFRIDGGKIIGLIGPNGAGKTTALKAMLGLTPFDGDLKVLGRDPRTQRDELMNDVCFIADVAVLPRWIRVKEAIDFVAGVHPRFDRARCERFLANTQLKPRQRVRELS